MVLKSPPGEVCFKPFEEKPITQVKVWAGWRGCAKAEVPRVVKNPLRACWLEVMCCPSTIALRSSGWDRTEELTRGHLSAHKVNEELTINCNPWCCSHGDALVRRESHQEHVLLCRYGPFGHSSYHHSSLANTDYWPCFYRPPGRSKSSIAKRLMMLSFPRWQNLLGIIDCCLTLLICEIMCAQTEQTLWNCR